MSLKRFRPSHAFILAWICVASPCWRFKYLASIANTDCGLRINTLVFPSLQTMIISVCATFKDIKLIFIRLVQMLAENLDALLGVTGKAWPRAGTKRLVAFKEDIVHATKGKAENRQLRFTCKTSSIRTRHGALASSPLIQDTGPLKTIVIKSKMSATFQPGGEQAPHQRCRLSSGG